MDLLEARDGTIASVIYNTLGEGAGKAFVRVWGRGGGGEPWRLKGQDVDCPQFSILRLIQAWPAIYGACARPVH